MIPDDFVEMKIAFDSKEIPTDKHRVWSSPAHLMSLFPNMDVDDLTTRYGKIEEDGVVSVDLADIVVYLQGEG